MNKLLYLATLVSLCLLWPGLEAMAQKTTSQSSDESLNGKRPLYFQAEKNGAQVVAQKFEYTLLDAQRIRIGDILIDASTFNFQLVRSRQGGISLKFNWPAGLLTQGQLILLNNNGKAVWSTQITEDDIRISAVGSEYANLRAELAEYTSPPIRTEMLNSMKFYPFMNFCISWGEANTKIYLCSKELYLSAEGRNFTIKERASTQKQASVEINGKAVGHQGIILLNDRNENIFFRARAESGAYLEIETRVKEVDFKDIVLSEDGQFLVITASGAEPVQRNKVNFIGDDLWQIRVPVDRPIIYLKGDGGIPMKQEFFIRGQVPTEEARIYVDSSSPERTYSSSLTLQVLAPPGGKINPGNQEQQVQPLDKNLYQWQITDIPRGETTRHYLGLNYRGRKYMAHYDVSRGFPFNLQAGLQYQAPSGVAYGYFNFQWWLGQFINPFRWGLQIQADIPMTKLEGYPEYSEYRLELIHKFSSGFQYQDEFWAVGLPLSQVSGKDISAMAFGLSFWGLRKPPGFFPKWVEWYRPKVVFLSGSGSSDIKFTNAWEVSTDVLKPLGERSYLTFGGKVRTYTFDPDPEENGTQFVLDAGYQLIF